MLLLAWLACGSAHTAPLDASTPPVEAGRIDLAALGLTTPSDLLIPVSPDQRVYREGFVTTPLCKDGQCLVTHVGPSETLRADPPLDSSQQPRLLPNPKRHTLRPGKTWTATPVALAADDPRGPLAEGTFTLKHHGLVGIEVTSAHSGPDHRGVHLPQLELLTPWDILAPIAIGSSPRSPDTTAHYWQLPPGTYTARVRPERVHEREALCAIVPLEGPPPKWCADVPDTGAYPITATLTVTEVPEPTLEPTVTSAPLSLTPLSDDRSSPAPAVVAVTPGHDVVVEALNDHDAIVYVAKSSTGTQRGLCYSPCVFPGVPFHRLELSTDPSRIYDVSVRVTQWSPGPAIGPLDPALVWRVLPQLRMVKREVEGASSWARDPRHAFVDLAFTLDEPGTYRVHAEFSDYGYTRAVSPLHHTPSSWTSVAHEPYPGITQKAFTARITEPGTHAVRLMAEMYSGDIPGVLTIERVKDP